MIFALHIHSRQISLQEPNEALMFPCDSERVAMLVMQCHVKDRRPVTYQPFHGRMKAKPPTRHVSCPHCTNQPCSTSYIFSLACGAAVRLSSCSSSSLNTRKGGHPHMQTPTLSVLTAQPSTEGTLAHRCSRKPFRRARETGLPTISMDSNSGGETRRPDMATRTGPKARRGL